MKLKQTSVEFTGKSDVLMRIKEDQSQNKTWLERLKLWLDDELSIPVPNALSMACFAIVVLMASRLLPPAAAYYAYTITVIDHQGNFMTY